MNIKKLFLASVVLVVSLFAYAQQAVPDNGLVITNTDLNIVYRGYNNKLQITFPGYKSADLIVKSEGATFTQEGDIWICHVSTSDKEIKMNVYAENGNIFIGSKTFNVLTLPDPVAYIKLADGTLWSAAKGGIKKSQFDGASVVIEYGYLAEPLTIVSFELLVADGRGGFRRITSDSNRFSEQQMSAIRSMRSGSAIVLSNIHYTGAKSGKNMPFEPLILK